MRRTVTLRTTLYALIAVPLLLTALLPARAEEAPFVSIVTDLAPGDLLNVRATASAMGKIKARLPNGTSVNNLGCNDVNGYRWCKVAEIDNPQLTGWAPARYLNPENPAAVADEDTETAGEGTAPAAEASNPAIADQPLPDLTARLGAAGQETTVTAAEAIGRAAIEDALALAASGSPSTGEMPPLAATEDAIQNRAANAAPPADAQTVARLQPPGPPVPGARNEIPCARYVGQPMTRCGANVERLADGKAEVTVTWPDGGTRVISFQAGRPAGSNASGEFRYTREGSLNLIRVGVSERFEIPDALATGG
ncbi:SH3 domain-containing protein [Mesorhizobium mediterraneum]|uniref:Peptide-binding protein n=1 Tax=Mesorhizobium mediterraneum TaxID=43617 RepID=A0AB36R228_9HYPH|nr:MULTISPECIES: SH3 domain-containing protein [Mesorhizobium]PAP98486.1 peptide-binding protein [Mesorhizobium mediterraneum]RUU44138.1 SH3 domain-containing protein [Mesorhizobium sp. M6A.T.Ce.TU.002.03.1.1]RUV01132.1 SH3 domain-containing protein [Mesorhizobium sp. M6A.T.Cr.TU.017.01.1.1]RWN33840.1 MAG: SH3 domain-containing protein [Mesorhizobium sp.]RWP03512.1 MAG: SH3 domain-containing protein [Mesorhizobium sp.]